MTPNQQTLLDLATRAEGVVGADRELDALIRCALFAKPDAFVRQSPINGEWCIYEPGYNGKERIWEGVGIPALARRGAFTSSLDAAMSLVPEGFTFRVSSSSAKSAYATVVSPLCEDELDVEHIHSAGGHGPALALTAAALRARSATCAS